MTWVPRLRVLGIDTALFSCAAALVEDGRPLAWRREERLRGHAERLLPMVAEVLAEAQASFADIDLVAVTVGPGTFTGLRIGLAAARGLALALDRPLAGVSTLEATAVAAIQARPDLYEVDCLAVIHDARRDEVYVELFAPAAAQDGLPAVRSLRPAAAPPLDQLVALLPKDRLAVVGTGVHLIQADLPSSAMVLIDRAVADPDPRIVARLGARQWTQLGQLPVRPLYLRAPDAKLPSS